MMDRVIASIEHDEAYRPIIKALRSWHEATAPDAISQATAQVAATIAAAALRSRSRQPASTECCPRRSA
jgi:hypothetical protein